MTTRHSEADARIAVDDPLRQAGWDPLDKSMVGTEVRAADTAATGPVIHRSRARPFETHAPVYDLEAAAGDFGPDRLVGTTGDEIGWAPVPGSVRLTSGQEPGSGKTVVFAFTKHHAARLARHLNAFHPQHQGRYAEVITSDVADPDALIRRFKTETFPMVAVSVGTLDTGFDCREVLHLVLCRRVRSPILYQQMRGRGTRTAPHIDKRKFVERLSTS